MVGLGALATDLGPWYYALKQPAWKLSLIHICNAACGLCYEGLAWTTGAAVMAYGNMPGWQSLALAGLYSAGAHGIMTLNDFKAVKGDRLMGIRSLPVQLGIDSAARMACMMMALPQMAVIALLFHWGAPVHAGGVLALLLAQAVLLSLIHI